jgi:protein kinase-like protein
LSTGTTSSNVSGTRENNQRRDRRSQSQRLVVKSPDRVTPHVLLSKPKTLEWRRDDDDRVQTVDALAPRNHHVRTGTSIAAIAVDLTAGQYIGPYEIVSPLGAGGMGEVYRAHDAKLKRDVALKILPAHISRDVERLARFEREARVLASLNHPHIATVYGVDETDGVRALILELVEGPTLAERLGGGPMPVRGGNGAAILEKPVSDRGTLEDLSQSRIYRSTCGRKLLILNGEMLERSIRHAWKLIPFAHADPHRNASTHLPSKTSRNNDVHLSVPANHGVRPGFRGYLTQF